MKLLIEVPNEIGKEFESIAKKAGLASAQSLLTNYVREVILAARSDLAAQKAREIAIETSKDLDNLIPPEKLTK